MRMAKEVRGSRGYDGRFVERVREMYGIDSGRWSVAGDGVREVISWDRDIAMGEGTGVEWKRQAVRRKEVPNRGWQTNLG